MTATRSPRTSASSMKCVVRSTTRPARRCFMKSQSALRLKGSIPLVGSSRITKSGRPLKAMATLSFLFMPPLSSPERYFMRLPMPSSDSSSVACARRAALPPASCWRIATKKSMCSKQVRSSHKTLCCGHTPKLCLTAQRSCGTRLPKMVTEPPVDMTMPERTPMVVVLPAPLCPRRTKISSGYMHRLRPSTARINSPCTPVKCTSRSHISTQRPASLCAASVGSWSFCTNAVFSVSSSLNRAASGFE
mmetsp:Transcript_31845/g.85073  ORF Transcript_31845/g.85073 Transcript_31845/m.85073 type:complete len:248 (+) Transcript_31845:4845-5588(+)